jgi:signal transduction histidine kinase/CheY-like chemotaxis protein
MIVSSTKLSCIFSAIMALVILLLGSVVYDSHRQSTLHQQRQGIAMANNSVARALQSVQGDMAALQAALSPLQTENMLFFLVNKNGELQGTGVNTIWAMPDTRAQLFSAIKASQPVGNLYTDDMKFVWASTAVTGTAYSLLTLQQQHDNWLSSFIADFGLPLGIMAAVMFWITMWVSLTLGSLFKKLNAQNAILEQQAKIIAEARDYAEKANIAKGIFLANMSHEIRTPLTAVLGYSDSLLDSDQTKEERLEAINIIHRSSQHVLQIINQILDLSKIEADKLEIEKLMVSPMQLLADVSALMRMQAREKGLAFEVSYKTPMPESIYTDPTRLKQILLNLFSNAVKFTAQGGVRITVSCHPEKQCLRLQVIDSGIGMNAEQAEKVFSAFTQAAPSTAREYGGTGLGLSLSRQFAEMLGGSLRLSSAPDKGSRFIVEIDTGKLDNIPFVANANSLVIEETPQPVSLPRICLQGEVLLVEDNAVNQRLLGMYLRKLGATVSYVDNGAEAIEQAIATPFDLILMDVQMPVMNGIDATRILRDCGYTRPIVALSANVASEDRQNCTDVGCDDFLGKPVDRARFNQVVSRYLCATAVPSDTSPVISQLLIKDPDFADLVEEYIALLPATLQAIRKAITQPDWCEFKNLIHQLKGSGGNYGFMGLTELAAKIEFQIINRHRGKVDELMAALEAYCKRIYAGKPVPPNNVTRLHENNSA